MKDAGGQKVKDARRQKMKEAGGQKVKAGRQNMCWRVTNFHFSYACQQVQSQ